MKRRSQTRKEMEMNGKIDLSNYKIPRWSQNTYDEDIKIFDTRILWYKSYMQPHNYIELKRLQEVRKIILTGDEIRATMSTVFKSTKEADGYYNKLLTMPELQTLKYFFDDLSQECIPFKGKLLIKTFVYGQNIKYGFIESNNDNQENIHETAVKIIKSSKNLSTLVFKNITLNDHLMMPSRILHLTELKLVNVNFGCHLNDIDIYFPNLERLFLCASPYKGKEMNYKPNDILTELSLNCIAGLWKLNTFHVSVNKKIPMLSKLVGHTDIQEMTIHMPLNNVNYDTLGELEEFTKNPFPSERFKKIHLKTYSDKKFDDLIKITMISNFIYSQNHERITFAHRYARKSNIKARCIHIDTDYCC